jgi:Zn-dependent metalloprotease
MTQGPREIKILARTKLVAIAGALLLALSVSVGAAEVKNLGRSPEVLARVKASGAAPGSAAFRDALGLPSTEALARSGVSHKVKGRDIARYRQTHRGVPVWGREIIVERDSKGRVNKLRGQLVADLDRDIARVQPGLKADDVVETMKARVRKAFGAEQAVFSTAKAELVVYAGDDGPAALSYAVSLRADNPTGGHPTRPVFIVDAFSGEVIFEYDAIAYQQGSCSTGCTPLHQTNISAGLNTWKSFNVTIPPGVSPGTAMIVHSMGGSGDADLYVRKGSQPTLSAYNCRPYVDGNDEICTVGVTSGETWYFGLYAYSAFSGVELRADVQAPLAQIGSGPGGNGKTGLYFYGREYDTLNVTSNATQCTMANNNVKTVNLYNGTSGTDAFAYTKINSDCYQASDPANGAYSPLNDAHYFGSVVYAMYNAYLGQPPLTFQLSMRVHYGTNYENAFWDGLSMTFGDGASTFYPLVGIDVAAHEVSHGFTEQNSNLVYEGESGGINEAFSDIAGEAAKDYFRGSADFLVGASVIKGSGFLRSMSNPTLDGNSIDNLADYHSGLDVHYSSGIYNKAFYLLATASGWNVQKAFTVFANANRYCWTPATGFVDGAQCVVDEAAELDWPVLDVVNAFAAVGITGLDYNVVPGTPVLAVTSTTATTVVLSWDDAGGQTSYSLRRSTTASGNLDASFEIATLGAGVTTFTNSGLTASTTYYYQLVAVNNDAESASAVVSAQTLAAPGC